MKNYQLLLLLTSIIAVPMLTSWLLDIAWIQQEWSRLGLIYLLMALEILIGVFMLRQLVIQKNKYQ